MTQLSSARIAAITTALVGTVILTGCSKEALTPLVREYAAQARYVDVEANFCTSPPSQVRQKIKYLFVLDHSQSNQPGFPNPLTPNDVASTDAQGSRRYGPLAQFISNLVPDPYNLTYFDIIDFNDQAYYPNGMTGAFDNDSANFLNNLKTDWIGSGNSGNPVPHDKGFTNYQAALQLAYKLIQADAQNESADPARPIVTTTYQIVFVSDGIPVISSPPGSPSPTTLQTFSGDIAPNINSILNLKNDPVLSPFIAGISLNTAYYYQNVEVPDAESLLQQMANAGNGQYLQVGTSSSIFYQAFAPPSRRIRYNLADTWVENKNAVWWDNGQLLSDSDGDGLPDLIEDQLHSNSLAADSDGNGVSDLVEYRTKGKPCKDARCSPAGRDQYSICDGFQPSTDGSGNVHFPSTTQKGLNDCENFVLGGLQNSVDSNGDFIPDFLSFRNLVPFIAGTTGGQADPFADGMSNYQKIKLGLPISVSKSKILDFLTRQSALEHVDSDQADLDCYKLTTRRVGVSGPGNTIKISVIQNTALIDDKPIMVSAERKLDVQSFSKITFDRKDFQ